MEERTGVRQQLERLEILPKFGCEISAGMKREYFRAITRYTPEVLSKAVDETIESEFKYPTIAVLKGYCERFAYEKRQREMESRRTEERRRKAWHEYVNGDDQMFKDCIKLIKAKSMGKIGLEEYIEGMRELEKRYPESSIPATLSGVQSFADGARQLEAFRERRERLGYPYSKCKGVDMRRFFDEETEEDGQAGYAERKAELQRQAEQIQEAVV